MSDRVVEQIEEAFGSATELPIFGLSLPTIIPGVDFSDHRNFWAAGYGAAMITDTAFYRNPNYHELTDTPETLDYERMRMVVDGVQAAVLALAESGSAE